MQSFIEVDPESDFSLANLPYGCYSRRSGHADDRRRGGGGDDGGGGGDDDPAGAAASLTLTAPSSPSAAASAPSNNNSSSSRRRLCVALGDYAIDLSVLQRAGLFNGPELARHPDCFQGPTLNPFLALGRPAWREARAALQRLLSASEARLRDDAALRAEAVVALADVELHLPFAIGDYTDFYASKHHAHNCGVMFRDPSQALPRNWLHLPVGYHGRASSVVVSGTPVARPRGQALDAASDAPVMRPSAAVDFELEVAAVVGVGNALGESVGADEAEAGGHVFGLVLMNDWSARDVQQWEMLPLGPFNAKNWVSF